MTISNQEYDGMYLFILIQFLGDTTSDTTGNTTVSAKTPEPEKSNSKYIIAPIHSISNWFRY